MRIWLVGLLLLLCLLPVGAGSVAPVNIADGSINFPCDGQGHWTPITAIPGGAVAKAYLFVSMSPSSSTYHGPKNGMDALLADPNHGNYPLAQVHHLTWTPSGGLQGEQLVTFSPDRMHADQAGVCLICWGEPGTYGLGYADVWVETP